MKGSSLKNLAMFRKLCGADSLSHVVFVTTKWDAAVAADAERLEAQLAANYLSLELASGAQTARHDNTAASARAALALVLGRAGTTLRLQAQLAQGLRLGETDAGAAVGADLETARQRHEDEAEGLGEELRHAPNEAVKTQLAERLAKAEEQLRRVRIDKEILEMDRAREVLAHQKRVEQAARQAGQSSQAVVTQGVSRRSSGLGPLASFWVAVMEILGQTEEDVKKENEEEERETVPDWMSWQG